MGLFYENRIRRFVRLHVEGCGDTTRPQHAGGTRHGFWSQIGPLPIMRRIAQALARVNGYVYVECAHCKP